MNVIVGFAISYNIPFFWTISNFYFVGSVVPVLFPILDSLQPDPHFSKFNFHCFSMENVEASQLVHS